MHIEQITADHKILTRNLWSEPSSNLRLPPLTRDLEIDYTALSLVAPEKVHFKYLLEGYDSDWQDAGNRRQAFYTNLPPRKYRFRVIASNNSGVWNEEGASLDFTILPAYYQTNWFRALCVATFVVLLSAAYLFRVRQLRRQEKKLRDVIETIYSPGLLCPMAPLTSPIAIGRNFRVSPQRRLWARVGRRRFTPAT